MAALKAQQTFYKNILKYYNIHNNHDDIKISKSNAFKFYKTSGLNEKILNLILDVFH